MFLKSYELGPLTTNSYLVACEKSKEAVIIDPACEDDTLIKAVDSNELKLISIINTHDHRDHTAGNYNLKARFGVPIQIQEDDAERLCLPQDAILNLWFKGEKTPSADICLKDGDTIEVGEIRLRVIHTPGHTPGGICLFAENEKILFTGDTLMANGIGRTDLVGGSYEDLIESIKNKLFLIDDSVKVYPGHGGATTIGHERKYNVFFH